MIEYELCRGCGHDPGAHAFGPCSWNAWLGEPAKPESLQIACGCKTFVGAVPLTMNFS